jgi:hypothetical protein
MENVGSFCGHLEYITAVWYIIGPFGNLVVSWYFFPVLIYCIKKNLATLLRTNWFALQALLEVLSKVFQ